MALYANSKKDAVIESVEFASNASGHLTFLHVKKDAPKDEVRQWLQAQGQTIIGETSTSVIARGNRPPQEMLQLLASRGDDLQQVVKPKKFDPWQVRSVLGFTGQMLQFISSFIGPAKPGKTGIMSRLDPELMAFSTANLTANLVTFAYGAQRHDDTHQLRFLKRQINDKLAPQLSTTEQPLEVDDKRYALRDDPAKKNQFNEFMKRNSVNVGELGLRYFGVFNFASPLRNWPSAIKAGQVPPLDRMDNGNLTLRAITGISSIAGKTLALGSKAPDAFSPEKHTWLDTVREKFTFLGGSIIEAGAFALLIVDAFFGTGREGGTVKPNSWLGLKQGGRLTAKSWLSGIGAVLFTTGYLVRTTAKYGTLTVDLDELYAHASDMLAKAPREKIPQLLAETAADLAEHFKKHKQEKKELSYGVIYSGIAADLEKHHQIKISDVKAKDITVSQSAIVEEATPENRVSKAAIASTVVEPSKSMNLNG